MSDTDKRHSDRRYKCVQLKRGSSAKKPDVSTSVRSTAGKKAARTRMRRASVLKTLKTGEESFTD